MPMTLAEALTTALDDEYRARATRPHSIRTMSLAATTSATTRNSERAEPAGRPRRFGARRLHHKRTQPGRRARCGGGPMRSSNRLRISFGFAAIGAALLVTIPVAAEDPEPRTSPTERQEQVREEPVFGRELMTEQELREHREKMRSLATEEERRAFREAHHRRMLERAREKGITLPEEPPAVGAGRGPGPGAGPGSGAGEGPVRPGAPGGPGQGRGRGPGR